MPLRTDIDETYPDDPENPSRKLHQQDHDALADQHNAYEGTTPAAFASTGALAAEAARALAAEALKADTADLDAVLAGLGTAAGQPVEAFDPAGAASAAAAVEAARALAAEALKADAADVDAALAGLGTAAAQDVGAFDPAGAAAAAQAAAVQRGAHTGTQPQDTVEDLVDDLAAKATPAEIAAAIADLVATAPSTLNTLEELAAALGDDPNFATTVLAAVGDVDAAVTALEGSTTAELADLVDALAAEATRAAGAEALAAQKAANLTDLVSPTAARTALGLGTAAVAATGDFDAAGAASAAAAAAQAASQPLDSDLTAIAALTTTTYGRALLALADAAAGRSALGLGTAAVANKVGAGVAGVLDATDGSTTNSRTPTAHKTSHEPGGTDAMTVDAAVGVGSLRTLGTGALQAMPGNTALGGAADSDQPVLAARLFA